MCGRYHVSGRDIYSSDRVTVFTRQQQGIGCAQMSWGFPGAAGGGLVINARAETLLEKPLFRDAARFGRIAAQADWFYEWNRKREKFTFTREDAGKLYLAGVFRPFAEGDRFVIITVAANDSMSPIHDRMPLILAPEDLEKWILDDGWTKKLLHQHPPQLKKQGDYEQLSLPFEQQGL